MQEEFTSATSEIREAFLRPAGNEEGIDSHLLTILKESITRARTIQETASQILTQFENRLNVVTLDFSYV